MTPEIVRAISKTVVREETPMRHLHGIETTDATPIVLFSIDTESYERGTVTYSIDALQDDGITGLSLKRVFSYKNDGTTLTITAGTELFADNEFTSADVSEAVNVNALEISATGEAATNITWIGTYEQQKINVEVALP